MNTIQYSKIENLINDLSSYNEKIDYILSTSYNLSRYDCLQNDLVEVACELPALNELMRVLRSLLNHLTGVEIKQYSMDFEDQVQVKRFILGFGSFVWPILPEVDLAICLRAFGNAVNTPCPSGQGFYNSRLTDCNPNLRMLTAAF